MSCKIIVSHRHRQGLCNESKKKVIDTNDVEGEKGWVKEIPSQLSLRPGVKWMAALPHLLPICQVVKHVGGLLRSSDHNWRSHPSVCHQHTTENPSRSQPKAFHTTCKNNFGRWSSTPKTRELYFNLTRTFIIRRVMIIQCHDQFLLIVFSQVCENSECMMNTCIQEALTPIHMNLCGKETHFWSSDRHKY